MCLGTLFSDSRRILEGGILFHRGEKNSCRALKVGGANNYLRGEHLTHIRACTVDELTIDVEGLVGHHCKDALHGRYAKNHITDVYVGVAEGGFSDPESYQRNSESKDS